MGFRFSLKWLLLATIYAAVAAAAFSQAHWAYADLLWAAAFFAITYAVMLAIFARGSRQGAAAGFAIASLLLVICLQASPDSVPTGRLVAALSPQQIAIPQPMFYPPTPIVAYSASTPVYPAPPTAAGNAYTLQVGPAPAAAAVIAPAAANPYLEGEKMAVRVRAANAVATIAAGLIGAVLGAAAVRRRTPILSADRPAPNSTSAEGSPP
jgi:hypothetical protein